VHGPDDEFSSGEVMGDGLQINLLQEIVRNSNHDAVARGLALGYFASSAEFDANAA
jgi:hypothetical protein